MSEKVDKIDESGAPEVEEGKEVDAEELKAQNEELKTKLDEAIANAQKADDDKHNAVEELIGMRKKLREKEEAAGGLVSQEEHERVLQEFSEVKSKLKERNSELADEILNKAASQPITPNTPEAPPESQLTEEQQKLAKAKGWTEEKYLEMKAKYPAIIKQSING